MALGLATIALGQSRTWRDLATFFGPTSATFNLCFGPDLDAAPPDWVEVRRIKIESGAVTITRHNADTWVLGDPGEQCLPGMKVPQVGHYAYEMRACRAQGEETLCSGWSSSQDPSKGRVQGQPKAWWVYGYVPPLGQPVPLPDASVPPTNEERFAWLR